MHTVSFDNIAGHVQRIVKVADHTHFLTTNPHLDGKIITIRNISKLLQHCSASTTKLDVAKHQTLRTAIRT